MNLRKLDLSDNTIESLLPLAPLSLLTHLSVDDNRIGSFQGIQHLASLMELYAMNNRIERTKHVLILKDLVSSPGRKRSGHPRQPDVAPDPPCPHPLPPNTTRPLRPLRPPAALTHPLPPSTNC